MPKDNAYDHLIKVLIVGDSGVGKTNMLLRFCENNFMNSHLTTIGIDFKTKTMNIQGKKIRMQIWDTAGQERFKTITQTYYRGAMGIFMTYAVDDRQSFDNIDAWIKQIKLHSSSNVIKVLIGNKSDSNKREVSFEEGKRMADQIDIPFFQTSAKDNSNIQICFSKMAKEIKNKVIEEDEIGVITYTGSKINKKNGRKDKSDKCC